MSDTGSGLRRARGPVAGPARQAHRSAASDAPPPDPTVVQGAGNPPAASGVRETGPLQTGPVQMRRKARLSLTHVDPWSVTKLAFVFSLVAAILLMVAVAVLWAVLDAMGVFESLSSTIAGVTKDEGGSGFVLTDYVGLGKVLSVAGIIALVDIILITALGTLAAFVYNLGASMTGGLEIILAEEV